MRQVHRLGDSAGDEGLHRAQHLDVAHVVDAALAALRLEGAVEDGQVLRAQARRALDRALLVDVASDLLGLRFAVAEAAQREGNGAVDDLHQAAAHQLLVLHQPDVRLHPGGIAVHHEGDGAGGGDDGGLGVAIAVPSAQLQRAIPRLARRIGQLSEVRRG